MNDAGFHIRDTIVLDRKLINSLPLVKLNNAKVKTLHFIGREVVLAEGELVGDETLHPTIPGFNVTIVADTLRQAVPGKGVLVVRAFNSPLDGNARPGPEVKVFCRNLQGINIYAKGGPGATGLEQEKEGKTGFIQCFEGQHGQQICQGTPEPDPTGPLGKRGGNGGAGGTISLFYVNDEVPGGFNPSFLQSVGGDPGDGGPGGRGGRIVHVHSDGVEFDTNLRGDQGKQGLKGERGLPVPAAWQKVDDATYASRVKEVLAGSDLAAWTAYRLGYAEYFFRAYNPDWDDRKDYLKRALGELDAIQLLDPTHVTAQKYRGFILNNQNVLGMARDTSVVPDFEAHRQIIADYEPLIQALFDRAQTRVFASLNKEDVKAQLGLQLEHLKAMIADQGPMALERAQAEEAKAKAQGEVDAATQQIFALKLKLDTLAIKVNAEGDDIELPGGGLPLFAAVATAVIGTVVVPGVGGALLGFGLALANGLIGNDKLVAEVQSIIKNSTDLYNDLEPRLKELADGSKGLGDYVKEYDDYLNGQNPMTPEEARKALENKLKEDFKSEVQDAKAVALSFSKLARELGSAKGKNDNQRALISVSREMLTLNQQLRQAKLSGEQAQGQLDIAAANLQVAQDDIGRLETLIKEIDADIADLKTAALEALMRARRSRDALLPRYFRLARALELYTLNYPPAKAGGGSSLLPKDAVHVRYDFGHIPPDVEQNYRDGELSGAKFILELDRTMPDVESLSLANLQSAYLDRGGRREDRAKSVLFTEQANADEIESFKTSRSLFFSVDLDDLPSTDFEAKVTGVRVRLTGVNAAGSTLNGLVKQVGRAEQRWLPGEQAEPPVVTQWVVPGPGFDGLDAVVLERGPDDLATYEGTTRALEPGNSQIELEVWGRGVAADWRVTLDDGAADLSNLSEIEVTLYYDAFLALQPGQSALAGVTHLSSALRPGTTAHAEVALVAPAPTQGMVVKLASSHPELVKVPSGVKVPAGADRAAFSIEIAKNTAGTAVRLTASADYTVSTRLFFPPAGPVLKQVVKLGTEPGFNTAVGGVAVNGKHVYASRALSRTENGHDSPEPGQLVVLGLDVGGTFKELAPRLGVGYQPGAVSVHYGDETTTIYVVNRGQKSYSLSVIDGDALKELKQLKLGFNIIDVAADGSRVYVSNWAAGKVHVVDGDTLTELPAIELPDPPALRKGLHGLAVDGTSKRVFVARTFHSAPGAKVNALTVIDADAQTVVGSVEVGPDPTQPVDVAVNSATGRVYTANLGGIPVAPGVTVLEPENGTYRVVKTVPTRAGALAVAMDTKRNHVYVAAGDGVQVIDAGQDAHPVVATVKTGKRAQSVAVDPGTGHVYVGDGVEGTVTRLAPLDTGTSVHWG